MHAHFLRAVLIQKGLFKILREKLELKAPQEQFKGQSLSSPRPVATALRGQHRVDPRRLKPSPWKRRLEWNKISEY